MIQRVCWNSDSLCSCKSMSLTNITVQLLIRQHLTCSNWTEIHCLANDLCYYSQIIFLQELTVNIYVSNVHFQELDYGPFFLYKVSGHYLSTESLQLQMHLQNHWTKTFNPFLLGHGMRPLDLPSTAIRMVTH